MSRFLHWTAPFPRRRLLRLLRSVDVLFDQIALPHFGATAPEGIAAGVPVIMSYDPASTRWIIPEPAPILMLGPSRTSPCRSRWRCSRHGGKVIGNVRNSGSTPIITRE